MRGRGNRNWQRHGSVPTQDRPLGSTEFVKKLEHSTHWRLAPRKGGRPGKAKLDRRQVLLELKAERWKTFRLSPVCSCPLSVPCLFPCLFGGEGQPNIQGTRSFCGPDGTAWRLN